MILHIPHSSRKLDGHIKLVDKKANLDYLTDTDVDVLFDGYSIKFPLSRFVCDVERFVIDEPMDKKGQGIIYKKDVFGNDIERITLNDIIYAMYEDHHRKLRLAVNKAFAYYRNVVIVDCHSFTQTNESDPDICIGTANTKTIHTPPKLISIVIECFHKYGLSVKINDPYIGSIVPKAYIRDESLKSIMIEVNKNVYMDNMSNAKPIITEVLEKIEDYEWNIA